MHKWSELDLSTSNPTYFSGSSSSKESYLGKLWSQRNVIWTFVIGHEAGDPLDHPAFLWDRGVGSEDTRSNPKKVVSLSSTTSLKSGKALSCLGIEKK